MSRPASVMSLIAKATALRYSARVSKSGNSGECTPPIEDLAAQELRPGVRTDDRGGQQHVLTAHVHHLGLLGWIRGQTVGTRQRRRHLIPRVKRAGIEAYEGHRPRRAVGLGPRRSGSAPPRRPAA